MQKIKSNKSKCFKYEELIIHREIQKLIYQHEPNDKYSTSNTCFE